MAFLIVLPAISVFSPQVKADTDNVVFQDDFEAYAVGSFPSAGGWELVWNGKGTEYQIVTDTVSTSPTRSFQLWGQPGWSANVQKLFTSSSEVIGYEAYVRTDRAFAKIAQVCFWNREALTWGKRFAQVNFYDNGEVYTEPVSGGGGIFLQNYEANRWYKVRVVIDKTTETYNVWIDDVLVAEDISIWDTNQIEAIELESGHAGIKAYFDDVKVFEGVSPPTSSVQEFWVPLTLPKGWWANDFDSDIFVIALQDSVFTVDGGTAISLSADQTYLYPNPHSGSHIVVQSGCIMAFYRWFINDYGIWDDGPLGYTLFPASKLGTSYLIPIGGTVGVVATEPSTTIHYSTSPDPVYLANAGDSIQFNLPDGSWVEADKPIAVAVGNIDSSTKSDTWGYAPFPNGFIDTSYHFGMRVPMDPSFPNQVDQSKIAIMATDKGANVEINGIAQPFLGSREFMAIDSPSDDIQISSDNPVSVVYLQKYKHDDPWTGELRYTSYAQSLISKDHWGTSFWILGLLKTHLITEETVNVETDGASQQYTPGVYDLGKLSKGTIFTSNKPVTIEQIGASDWAGMRYHPQGEAYEIFPTEFYALPTPFIPEKGEPRGIFVRFSQLLKVTDDTPLDPVEVRERIDNFVKDLYQNNITSIYIGFKSDSSTYDPKRQFISGVLMYKSELYPGLVYSPFKDMAFDPMQYLVEKAHSSIRPIEVHAWIPVLLDRLGIEVMGLRRLEPTSVDFVDPSDPNVLRYFKTVVTEIQRKYRVDGLNLDYLRVYEGANVDTKDVANKIVQFVANVRYAFPDMVLSADIWHLPSNEVVSGSKINIERYGQDWIGISQYVDVLMPMLYHFAYGQRDPNWVGDQVTLFWKATKSSYVTPIVHARRSWEKHMMYPENVTDAIESAIRNNADGFAIFHYCGAESLEEIGGLTSLRTVLEEPTVASWQLQVNFETDAEAYWMIFPTINFDGEFYWKTYGNPLSNMPITVDIRTPLGMWLDFELHGFTGDDGVFFGQLTGIAMWPGEWLLRVRDDTYGSAAIETFQVIVPPRNILFIAFSPVDIHVYDPEGRHIGVNATGGIDVEIPGAFYSGPETDPEFILIPHPTQGSFDVVLSGTAEGNFTFSVMLAVNETMVIETSLTAYIKQGQKRTFTTEVSETGLKFYVWQYVFRDSKRETELRINTDDKYFQFITPDKTFSVKYDPDMFVYKHFVFICYKDDELKLVTLAVDTRLDFCFAYVKDMQTSQRYLLIDKPGTE